MTNTIWRQYLQSQGAKFDGHIVTHYDNSASDAAETHKADSKNNVIPLTQYEMIVVQGADAETFLQGQLTCDIHRLHDKQVLLGGHCNPKGRLISSVVLAQLPEGKIGLRVHHSIAQLALSSLQKYIVFSKADITMETWAMFAIEGAQSATCLKKMGLQISEIPEQNKTFTTQDKLTCIKHNDSLYELWVREQNAQQYWQSARQQCSALPSNAWDLLQITQAIPEIRTPNSEVFLPQALNFDAVDAVSYKKGCYTGQEIIARLHYKGTSKKYMLRGRLPATAPLPKVGQSCISKDSQSVVGTVIHSASDSQYHHLLAVVPTDTSENQNALFLDGPNQHIIEWLPSPYAIP